MNQLSFRKNKLFFVLIVFALIIFSGCSKGVQIGNQVWMIENLNVDHYRNGDPIPEVKNGKEWSMLKTGAWCYYNNNPADSKKSGKLYNWYAVNDSRGLAPEGWRMPTKEEFDILINLVGKDGNALKIREQRSNAGSNTSGFSAFLSGYRSDSGNFCFLGCSTYFWSSTEHDTDYACYMCLDCDGGNVGLSGSINKNYGYSVRCVKD
jgi:uncharacterized protein (TIGR02145 family)